MSVNLKLNPTSEPAPTCTPVRRGFPGLVCPRCGERDTVVLDLADLTGDEAVRCLDCENNVSLDEIHDLIAGWSKVLAWVDLAPQLSDE